MEHTYAVIMAGGGGTRLWPISRKEMPKQLLPLLGKETLFQSTVSRLELIFPPERILVVTVADQARELAETKYSYEAYLARTRQACAYLIRDSAPQVAGGVA